MLTALVAALPIAANASSASTVRGNTVPPHVMDMVPADAPVEGTEAIPLPPETSPAARAPGGQVKPPSTEKPPQPKQRPVPQPQPTPTTQPSLQYLAPKPGALWYDGQTVTIRWATTGPVKKVKLYYYGERCSLGGRSRGEFSGVVNDGSVPNTGQVSWKVPWLDSTSFMLTATGYDANSQKIAYAECKVRLLPREFADLPDTCIAVSKRLQRLYYFEDGVPKRMHIVSTAAPGYTTPKMKPGSYSRQRGEMGKVFSKARNPFSKLYQVNMPYWLGITSSGSHGIHATSPNMYSRLGRPASHGCIRQHRADARVLYGLVKVGTPVYVF